MTFWLLVVMLSAWGVERLWNGMVPAKVLNVLVLPGTLVAQVGHVLGLLVTGATVTSTALLKDDESAAPETTKDPKPRIPVVGPVIIGLLPLLACGTAIYYATRQIGLPILERLTTLGVRDHLPTSLAGLWQLLRDQVSLVESLTTAIRNADFENWRTWAFLYLMLCLCVRIAPFPGTLRGSLGAVIVLGLAAAAISSAFDVADPRVRAAWVYLNLTVAAVLLLLLLSLAIRGAVGLVQLLRTDN
ncbi:MAG: hypothetical protein HY763_04695 [Planctomycetes bacterium]|nr:hypothetical protein [Planctomycetota bacterium]